VIAIESRPVDVLGGAAASGCDELIRDRAEECEIAFLRRRVRGAGAIGWAVSAIGGC